MARRDKEFLGLEVVNLDDATVAGEVDGLIVDEESNSVVGLIVDMGLYEANVLAMTDVQTVGEDAVLIETANLVKPISDVKDLETIANRGIHPDDALVLTDAGDIVGITGDFFVDSSTGALKGIEVLPGAGGDENTLVVPMDWVVRIGRDIVLVSRDYETRAVHSGESL